MRDAIELTKKPLHVLVPRAVPQLNRLTTRQRRKARGKCIRRGHLGAMDECGDEHEIATQRVFDLETHEVIDLFQASPTLPVGHAQPQLPDQQNKDIAGANGRANPAPVVAPRCDGVHVHEDVLRSKPSLERVVEPSRMAA
jgi:hypothetical protein